MITFSVVKAAQEKCKFILEAFQTMARELGLPLAEEKTEGPANSLMFWEMCHGFSACIYTLRYNIVIQAKHIPGLDNSLADALTCQQINRFRELDPGASEFPETFLLEVWQIGVMMQKEQ